MTTSVLARIDKSQIVYDPFPHVVVTEALEPSYYAELAKAFPSLERVQGGRALENNKAYLLNAVEVLPDPEISEIWRDFFSYHTSEVFFREALNFWDTAISREYPDLKQKFGKPLDEVTTALRPKAGVATVGNDAADAMLDVQFGINSPVTEVSRVRGPHVDKPYKLFAGLLYFRHPDDDATGGDLGLYRYRGKHRYFDSHYDINDRYVDRVIEVPYRANTFVMWLNTPNSLHGVSPRSLTAVPRRYVNFLAECYRLTSDGFFPVPRSPIDRALGLLSRST